MTDVHSHGGEVGAEHTGFRAAPDVGSELGLFVIWSNARTHESRILEDLRRRFTLLDVFEVHWSPDKVVQNYDRFYRARLTPPYRTSLEYDKGSGPLLAVVVRDESPSYGRRQTTGGQLVVSTRVFDAKDLCRSWTGGGTNVHSSDSPTNAARELSLLLSLDPQNYQDHDFRPWDGTVKPLHRDLAGANGWASASELFRALNAGVDYVVLRNFENLPQDLFVGSHADLDLLTDHYRELVALLNGRPLMGVMPRWGGRFLATIQGNDVICDVRFVGDAYYDPAWARRLLDGRVLRDGGYSTPNDEDYLESLLYHAVVHKPSFKEDYRSRLASMASELDRPGWTRAVLDDPIQTKRLLAGLLTDHGYRYRRPHDPSVFYNDRAVGHRWPLARRIHAGLRRRLVTALNRRVRYPLQIAAHRLRETLLGRAPVIRQLKRTVSSTSSQWRDRA